MIFWTRGFQIQDCNINNYSVNASGNEITGTSLGCFMFRNVYF